MEHVRVAFTYTKEEFVKAVRQFLVATRRVSRSSRVLVPLCFGLSIAYLFLASFSALSIVFLVVATLALITGILVYGYVPVRNYNSADKYKESYELDFSKDGIVFKTQSIDSTLQWSTYRECWENKKFFYLMQNQELYTILPKRAFTEDGSLDAFREIARAALEKDIKRV